MVLLVLALLTAVATTVLVRRGVLRWAGSLALIAVAMLTAGVAELTDNVVDRDGATGIDTTTMNWVVPHRTGWLTPIAKAISDLGDTTTMAAVAAAACAWFAYRRRWPQLLLTGTATAGAGLIVVTLKAIVGRQRPPVVDRLVTETNQSYPSGHTLGSTVVVGVLTALVILAVRRRAVQIAVGVTAAAFVTLVGLSRLYLGVHWPTDVLAGWAIGTLWATVCLAAYLRLRRPATTTSAQPA
ncbi:phosphatase PAP2 family protein [Nocardia sp. alder85J]|uniref:phosphatase PAP2 family protein n=1 Tax=Nocardia sp. alder85J TaxID=2862949 RepID=UPI001CD237EC|nr:phosphatase PAP2 family protein [Nocardia sp. alder85J]MCX4092111.1 phosphatase PAP2 family protein [Nocardia sp. alder85J]